jgi:tRNA threonylcarbamoyladenosine biosynthesis protein TsaE
MTISIKSTEDLEQAAKEAVLRLETIDAPTGALVVGLIGELGAGKTTFTQYVAKSLGISEHITSPTFVIEKIYALPPEVSSRFSHFVHIDAYRLTSGRELQTLGWDRLISDHKNLIFVEWADKVKDIIPQGSPLLSFHVETSGTRTLTWHT